LAAGKTFKLVSIDELEDDKLLCTPYMLGALALEQDQIYDALPQAGRPSIMVAYQRLTEYFGKDIDGTVCCELGGSNTAISFYLAAMIDGVIIDADPAGRAVPEITHSTYYLNDLPAAPIITANEFGECFVLENIKDDQRAEHVVRALSMISRNDIAAIDHVLPVSELKHALIKGTISKALAIGEAYRRAKAEGKDIAQAVAEFGGGQVQFRGKVSSFVFKTQDGFTLGTVDIEGQGSDQGNHYRLNVKNENLSSELNGKIDVTIPELICCFDMDSLQPVTNPHFSEGMNVAIVVLPAPSEFTTPRGLKAFGPQYLGLNTPYRPVVKGRQ